MIKISHVEYINTLPYKIALENSDFIRKTSIITKSHPAGCANELKNGDADIGLVPIGALNDLPEHSVIAGFGLASKFKVNSVLVMSQVPLDEIKNVYLDYQSRSSNGYLKILSKYYWKKNFNFLNSEPNYINKIKDATAALVIGDKALQNLNKFNYVYDLAEEWFKFSNLPSVYAVWVTNGKADDNYISEFKKVIEQGVVNREEIAKQNADLFNYFDLVKYLCENIAYRIEEDELKSMGLYFKLFKNI